MKEESNNRALRPVDVALVENIELEGAVFVRLRTLDALQTFWAENKTRYAFAARGIELTTGQMFLNGFEWIFATSKANLVRAFTRWDHIGIECTWYDWMSDATAGISHETWFRDRDERRLALINEGTWSEVDEQAYQRDCTVRTPASYKGWWRLTNLPNGISHWDWFGYSEVEEIFDPSLSVSEVARRMQELTYESFKLDSSDVAILDSQAIDEELRYWLTERANGFEYYGFENISTA